MRSATVPFLLCPACRCGEAMEARVQSERDGDILEGTLVCPRCASVWPISGGIANLLGSASTVVEAEREVYRRSREELDRRLVGLSAEEREAQLRRIAFMEHTGEEFRLTSTINLEGVLERLRPQPGQWLVELGAGSGWLTAHWAARGLRCVAVDISPDLKLELSPYVMAEAGVSFDRIVASMTRLPLRTASMEWVFVSASLHHAESLSASLAEAARVLRPGGLLVAINEPMHGLLRRGGKRFVEKAAQENPGLNEQSFTYFQWRTALRTAGLRPRFLFPPYYAHVLQRRATTASTAGVLARLAAAAWHSPLRGLALSRPAMALARVVFGLNVCCVAAKEGAQ